MCYSSSSCRSLALGTSSVSDLACGSAYDSSPSALVHLQPHHRHHRPRGCSPSARTHWPRCLYSSGPSSSSPSPAQTHSAGSGSSWSAQTPRWRSSCLRPTRDSTSPGPVRGVESNSARRSPASPAAASDSTAARSAGPSHPCSAHTPSPHLPRRPSSSAHSSVHSSPHHPPAHAPTCSSRVGEE